MSEQNVSHDGGGPVVPGKYYPGQRDKEGAGPVKKGSKDPKGRAWCFTMWSEDQVGKIMDIPSKAIVIAREECPETGREHYQGYVRYTDPVRFSWFRNQFPGAHFELREGSEEMARAYIADTKYWNENTKSEKVKSQGEVLVDRGAFVGVKKDSDVTSHVLDMLEAGAPTWQIYKAHRVFYFHNNKKINDVRNDILGWQEMGVDFKKV